MSLNLEDNQNPYFPALGLNATLIEIQEFINNNVTPKYRTSVSISSAQLDDWGNDDEPSIVLIQSIPDKFINVTSVKVRETGAPSQDFIDNWQGATIANKYAMRLPTSIEYYICFEGISGGGTLVPSLAIVENNIDIYNSGDKYDAGTLAYTFEIEYELIDLV